MGHIVNGKNLLRERPQPGRPINPTVKTEKIVTERVIEKESKVDVDAIADAVVKALGSKTGGTVSQPKSNNAVSDDYDESATLKQLAKSMTVQRGAKASNFEDLGSVKTTKKDKSETDATIDLLKDVDDENN